MKKNKIIAIANQKGGVGKTTSAVNISASLAEKGNRVLMVDLDPQGNLTSCFGFDPEDLEITIADVLEEMISRKPNMDRIETLINKSVVEIHSHLTLIPSNITLSGTDTLMVNATKREFLLDKLLKMVIDKDGALFDYIIIDCPPALGMLTTNALTACDSVLIPVKAQYLGYKGFNQLFDSIICVSQDLNPKIKIEGVFLTMYNGRINMAKKVEQALLSINEEYGISVLSARISQCTAAAEASYEGQDIFTYAPDSKTAKEYEMLVDELLKE